MICFIFGGCSKQVDDKSPEFEKTQPISELPITEIESNMEEPSTNMEEPSTNVENENIVINQYGNAFSNLGSQCSGYSFLPEDFGRVTGQDDKTYFYELYNLYCMDSKGEKTVVCPTNEISCLNIIGDTLYFLEGTKIWSVKTDGSEKKELLINVCGSFFVSQNSIIYVTKSNITATRTEFFICRYLIDGNEPQQSISTGEMEPILIGMGPNDTVFYYYQIDPIEEKTGWSYKNYYQRYALFESDFTGEKNNYYEHVAAVPNAEVNLWAMCSKDNIYIIEKSSSMSRSVTNVSMINPNLSFSEILLYAVDSTEKSPRNCYENDLLMTHYYEGSVFLYLYGAQKDGSWGRKNIVLEEKTGIKEVYVINDYVYYTVDDSYYNANLYRIKIDGTCWEDI